MKIKWIGKYNGTNLPVVPVEESMKVLPEVNTKHAIALIPILLGLSLCVIFKNRVLHERVLFTREMLAGGFLSGLCCFLFMNCFMPYVFLLVQRYSCFLRTKAWEPHVLPR